MDRGIGFGEFVSMHILCVDDGVTTLYITKSFGLL